MDDKPTVSSTLLDAHERECRFVDDHIEWHFYDRKDPCITFRHSGWAPMRQRVWRALIDAGTPARRIDRFAKCGHDAWVVRSVEDPSKYRVFASTCHDRFCLPCQAERSRVIAANLLELTAGKTVRLITLTLRADTTPLADRVDRLNACFRRLRKTELWRRRVKGGAAFLELKFSETHRSWHTHLHIIAVGRYLPKTDLATTWHRITGDSHIVDVRFARSQQSVAHYVTKYVSKPFDRAMTHNQVRLTEAVASLSGVKLCTTFGSFRGSLLTVRPSEGSWEQVGSLRDLLAAARRGNEDAAAVVRSLNQDAVHNALQHVPPEPRPPPQVPRLCHLQLTLGFDVHQF
jgi:hypothetical protein